MSKTISAIFISCEVILMGAPVVFPELPFLIGQFMFWGGLIALAVTILSLIFKSPIEPEETATGQHVISYNQSGGITARNVNIGDVARTLTEDLKIDLLSKISKNKTISITHIAGDSEAYKFAREIGLFLRSQGYNWEYFMSDSGIYGGNGYPNISEDNDSIHIYVSSKGNTGIPLQFTGGALTGLKPE